jgi:hypothetical protein
MRKPSKTDVVFDKEKDPLLLQGNIFFNWT